MMNRIIYLTFVMLVTYTTNAQDVLYNNDNILHVNTGCIVQVNGNLTNKSGSTFTVNGSVTVTGNSTNDEVMTAPNDGTLVFNGTTAQSLNGAATYFSKNVLINNAAGVTLNTPLKVDGIVTFTNGMVTAAGTTTPLIFTANGTPASAADASHVIGYVVKEGTGSFTYPVGDGTSYQKVETNLSANATGMQVRYNATDAGASPFTTGGTEATPLIAYNPLENWELTPLSTASGTVTMFWDAYKNVGILSVSDLKVAHKSGGNWLNEGTTGTGTIAAGSVTSNAVSTWSPFTLGSIGSSPLPLEWLSVTGSLNTQNQATINWKVNEIDVANYIVEKSNDGWNFSSIVSLNSKGDGTHNYTISDETELQGTGYFRIKQIDNDDSFTFSTVIALSNNSIEPISTYPNPVKDIVTISGGNKGTKLLLTDINGRVLQQFTITQPSINIGMSKYSSGVYMLMIENGATQKIIKE